MLRSRRVQRHVVASIQCLADAVHHSGAATVVVDVEPLLAGWHTPSEAVVAGAAEICSAIGSVARNVRCIVFTSNSRRELPRLPHGNVIATRVVPAARKPWRTDYLRYCPRPLIVVGDQLITDGLLAWRVRAAFLHWLHAGSIPWWPRLQAAIGRIVCSIFFTRYTPGT